MRDSHQITDKYCGAILYLIQIVFFGGAEVQKFRSQLMLDEQRFLFDVWCKASLGNQMPSRAEFSPCCFGPLLPFVSLVEFKDEEGPKIRVTGSGLRDVFGKDPRLALAQKNVAGAIDTINQILECKKPMAGTEEIDSTGRYRFWLRLPLGRNGKVESIVGLDLTISGSRAPAWAFEQIRANAK